MYHTSSYIITHRKQPNSNILFSRRKKNERIIINSLSTSSSPQNSTINPIMLSVADTLTKSDNWMLLPWLPSRTQILSLNLSNLRRACQERGLSAKGSNLDVQNSLIEWTQEQHKIKVNSRSQFNLEPDYYSVLHDNNRLQYPMNSNITGSIMDYRVVPFEDSTKSRNRNRLDRQAEKQFYEIFPSSSSQSNLTSSSSSTEYLQKLTQTFQSSPYSKSQLQTMYNSAKEADQRGDITASKTLLLQLLSLTPHDGRILRRLSRLEQSKGDMQQARSYLLQGLKIPDPSTQGYFYHALGVMEVQQANFKQARTYFTKALELQPTFPNTYHAWSRMEYSQGNIKLAVRLLKKGLFYTKTNHRLYHELGNLYREAGLYQKSEECLQKGIDLMKKDPNRNFPLSFLYTSMSYVYYEMHGYDEAKLWLEKALSINNLHAQGWLALAQLEESEGNIKLAEETYIKATSFYESFMERKKRQNKNRNNKVSGGDRWSTVYLSWGRMERNELKRVEMYQRALRYFPNQLAVWMELIKVVSTKKGNFKMTKQLFELACAKVGKRNVEPYQHYAEYEISLSNLERARSIYLQGAQVVCNNNNNSDEEMLDRSLSKFFHSWAKLEIRLHNFKIANQLLDKSLQVLPIIANDNNTIIGSLAKGDIFMTMAKMEYKRENYYMAQHCICQSLLQVQSLDEEYEDDEHAIKLAVQLWRLWSDIAYRMRNEKLERDCWEQVCIKEGRNDDRNSITANSVASRKTVLNRQMKKILGKAPWYRKLFL